MPALAPARAIRFPRAMRALRRWLYWLPAATWMALIYLGSTGLLAESRTSRFLAPFLRWLVPGISEDSVGRIVLFTRKCAHAGEYGLLAGLLLAALNGSFRPLPREWSWARAGGALLVCAAYAVTDEVHQAFVPSRFGNPVDVLIDTAGAAAALLLLWLYGRWRRRW
jgi:VanZ family protein